MSNLIFKYGNIPFNGLFNYTRSNPDQYHISVNSPRPYMGSGYCYKLVGKEASGIIDGDFETAWANLYYDKQNTHFIINLGNNSFTLHSFDFSTTCNPPKEVEILGSNDNQTFYHICNVSDMIKEYQVFHRDCNSNMRSYKIFKIQQHTAVNNDGRFHLSEIEFYGILNPIIKTIKYTPMHYYLHSRRHEFILF